MLKNKELNSEALVVTNVKIVYQPITHSAPQIERSLNAGAGASDGFTKNDFMRALGQVSSPLEHLEQELAEFNRTNPR